MLKKIIPPTGRGRKTPVEVASVRVWVDNGPVWTSELLWVDRESLKKHAIRLERLLAAEYGGTCTGRVDLEGDAATPDNKS